MKVVINKCYGGFSLSYEGMMKYAELKGIELYAYSHDSRSKCEPFTGGVEPWCLHYTTKKAECEDDLNEHYFTDRDILRHDPALVQTVEEMGEDANGHCALLVVIEIPDDVSWHIEEYDGVEWVAEDHRTWG